MGNILIGILDARSRRLALALVSAAERDNKYIEQPSTHVAMVTLHVARGTAASLTE